MFKDLQGTLTAFFKKDGDPLSAITPEQLKAVLKSIEGKYNSLRDENRRLKGVIEDQRDALSQLDEAQGRSSAATLAAEQGRIAVQQAQERTEALIAQCEEAHRHAESLVAEREALLARIRDLEPLTGRIAVVEQERDRAELERDQAEQAKATAIRLADADAEKAALRAQLAELRTELDQQAAAAIATPAAEPAELARLQDQLDEARQLQDQARAEADKIRDELWDELWETRKERDRLLAERDALRQERDDHGLRLHEALEAARDAQSDRAAAAEALQIVELKLQAATGQRNELNVQLEAASARVAALECANEGLEAQIREFQARVERADQELAERGLRAELPSPALEPPQLDAGTPTERELVKAIAAIAEQVGRLSTPSSSPALSLGSTRPPAGTQRSRPRSRKPAAAGDPARKLDWLMGL